MPVPQRTFAEARRIALRANEPAEMQQEIQRHAQEARQRVRALDAPYRARLEEELAELVRRVQANNAAAKRLHADLTTHRLTSTDVMQRMAKIGADQRRTFARAQVVKERLAALDQREENATQVVDRMAQSTGLGKPNFSF